MAHVVIDIAMSLDGYVAGPHDGPDKGLGENGGEQIMESHMPSTHIRRTAARGNRCGVAPTATPLRSQVGPGLLIWAPTLLVV